MKAKNSNLPQHHYDQGHWGELPFSSLPSGSNAGDTFLWNGTSWVDTTLDQTINFIFDGGGSVVSTGIKGDVMVDFTGTITSATLLADVSGSFVCDIWKDTYPNFPPTDSDSITASAPPTLSSQIKSQDSTLTGWNKTINAGDIFRLNVDSATTVKRVTLALKVRRSG